MFTRRRLSHRFFLAALAVLLLSGARWAAGPRASATFTPLVRLTLPQRAAADFDADGLPDLAVIQEDRGGSHVSVILSGSPHAVTFEMDAVSVAASDIDHDGDTDLVVLSPSNHVVIWRNDGSGHFTQEEPLPPSTLASTTSIADTWPDEPVLLGPTVPQVIRPVRRREAAVIGNETRPPTMSPAVALGFLAFPSLRAPPATSSLN
jgi:FG-GAP-like repeat